MEPSNKDSNGFIPSNIFKQIIDRTPLISIDIIVLDKGKALLGKRLNRPACGDWFVPGGRVRKNETLNDAFKRLSFDELGTCYSRQQATFLGVFEHYYSDSVFGEVPSTHYVALAYTLELSGESISLSPEQHSDFLWWELDKAISSSLVHQYTKDYLQQLLT